MDQDNVFNRSSISVISFFSLPLSFSMSFAYQTPCMVPRVADKPLWSLDCIYLDLFEVRPPLFL